MVMHIKQYIQEEKQSILLYIWGYKILVVVESLIIQYLTSMAVNTFIQEDNLSIHQFMTEDNLLYIVVVQQQM